MLDIITPARRVITKIGTQKTVADLLGVHPSIVSRWHADGLVPARYMRELWRLNEEQGLGLEHSDFFEETEGEGP